MQRLRLVVAVLLGVVGSVWVGQGLGFLPGSFMTGDRFWAVAGIVALSVGVYLAWDALRRR
jgi:uncharacterized membrane protein